MPHVLDLEFLKKDIDCEGGLTASAGLRYVRMDQYLKARNITPAGVLAAGVSQEASSRHDFEGIGPTVSAEMLKRFDCSNWGMFINVRGSILYGESNTHYQDAPRVTPNALASRGIDRNDQDIIPVGEIQLGLDYRRPSDCHEPFLRVALETLYWMNGGSANAQENVIEAGNAKESDMGFLGITIATGLDW